MYIDTKARRSVSINVRLYQHEMEYIKAAAVMNQKSQSLSLIHISEPPRDS